MQHYRLFTQQLLLSLLLASCIRADDVTRVCSSFQHAHIRLCLRPQFVRDESSVPSGDPLLCSIACLARGARCQGFRLTNDSSRRCQTLEFDSCSHMVNAGSCSQFAWAYIRKQRNLPDGQLCPPGYSSGFYGNTYKFVDVTSWTDGLNKCSSESGLTKFADGMDRAEVDHLHWIKSNVNSGGPFFVGGFREGSAASGTWFWHGCNASFLPEVWLSGQPSGGDAYNRANIWSSHVTGIDDITDTYGAVTRALCECVNPFV